MRHARLFRLGALTHSLKVAPKRRPRSRTREPAHRIGERHGRLPRTPQSRRPMLPYCYNALYALCDKEEGSAQTGS